MGKAKFAKELKEIPVHTEVVNRLSWSPGGHLIATASHDGTIGICDVKSLQSRRIGGGNGRAWTVSWSPGSTRVASVDDKGLALWDVQTEVVIRPLPMQSSARSARFHPHSELLAIGTEEGDIIIYDVEAGTTRRVLRTHEKAVDCLAWAPAGRLLASAARDGRVAIWEEDELVPFKLIIGPDRAIPRTVVWSRNGDTLAVGWSDGSIRFHVLQSDTVRVIDAHRKGVADLSFSYGDSFFASRSWDNTVRIWRCDTWDLVEVLDVRASPTSYCGLSFHSDEPMLAAADDSKAVVRSWRLSLPSRTRTGRTNSHYQNAKVVLAGDNGAGKSGLRRALLRWPYKPLDSSHGRFVDRFSQENDLDSSGNPVTRETLVWDLAGNPGYRVVNQLHLEQATVGIVAFDSSSDRNPFAGVGYWARALDRAAARRTMEPGITKLLVATKLDRGRPLISKQEIDHIKVKFGFSDYHETSALEGWGIDDLRAAVAAAVRWDAIPTLIVPRVLATVFKQAQQYREQKAFLVSRESFTRELIRRAAMSADDVRDALESLAKGGFIRELSFGGLLLVQPEALDGYCASIALGARSDTRGLGFVPESLVLAGKIPLDVGRPLANRPDVEGQMLLAAVQEVVDREIAIRVHTEAGSELGFPSEGTRVSDPLTDPFIPELAFDFQGPVSAIAATLAVRLANSPAFGAYQPLKGAATFRTVNRIVSGFVVRYPDPEDDGSARLEVFFDATAPRETKLLFLRYINHVLERSAIPGSLHRERIYVHCDIPISSKAVAERKRQGRNTVICPVCQGSQPMDELEEEVVGTDSRVARLLTQAQQAQENESRLVTLPERERRHEYDVFISYHTPDRQHALALDEALRLRGLNVWVDTEYLLAGTRLPRELQKVLRTAHSAILLIGQSRGEWQQAECEALIQREIEDRDFTLISVVLPGATQPEEPFLRRLIMVEATLLPFSSAVIDQLVIAILGRSSPQREPKVIPPPVTWEDDT